MSNFDALIGEWVHVDPVDSDDYRSRYIISGNAENPIVSGQDLSDEERFEITEVHWDGKELSFVSLMPSTNRSGINVFRPLEGGRLESKFTFTVREELKKCT